MTRHSDLCRERDSIESGLLVCNPDQVPAVMRSLREIDLELRAIERAERERADWERMGRERGWLLT